MRSCRSFPRSMKENFVNSVVAVYSATGNSLAVAKRIESGEIHMVEEFLDGEYTLDENTERLGLVFPINCFGIPYPIQRFIKEYLAHRDNSNLQYIYGVVTYAKAPLTVLADLETELSNIGCALSYGISIKLPLAYLPLKKKAVSEIETLAAINKVEKKINRCKKEIEDETISIPSRGLFRRAIRFLSRLSTEPRKNDKLAVEGSCTGCGICTHICPMDNIEIENGKAIYKDRCISCFACYHRCPENAIAYPGASGQYQGLVETKELYRR